jgi:hypothetical protein
MIIWRTLCGYILLLFLIQGPFTSKHHRAQHFKTMSEHNDAVNIEWVSHIKSSNINMNMNMNMNINHFKIEQNKKQLRQQQQQQHQDLNINFKTNNNNNDNYNNNDDFDISNNQIDQMDQLQKQTCVYLVKEYARHISNSVSVQFTQLYANIVWTPLIKLYLDGYSILDDSIGFWEGKTEAQICSQLRKYHDNELWEREKWSCRRMIFERLNSFLETLHFITFFLTFISMVKSICDSYSYRYHSTRTNIAKVVRRLLIADSDSRKRVNAIYGSKRINLIG